MTVPTRRPAICGCAAVVFVALVAPGSFLSSAKADLDFAQIVGNVGYVAQVVKLGIGVAEVEAFNTKDQLQKLTPNVQSLVNAQAAVFETASHLKLGLVKSIEDGFKQEHLRDLNAELDDLAIWGANGTLQTGRHLREKADKLERMSLQMARYGVAAMPSFVAVNSALYAVNRPVGWSDAYRANVYAAHAGVMLAWISDDSDLVREYRKAHAVQSALAITARTESPIVVFDAGRVFYKLQGVRVMSNLKARIEHKSDNRVLVTPIIHPNVAPSPEFPDLGEGQIVVRASQIPDIYREVFSLPSDDKSQVLNEKVLNSAEADRLGEQWIGTYIAGPMQRIANGYVDDSADHDKRFHALEQCIAAIETSVALLQAKASELRGAALQASGRSQIKALPASAVGR